MIYNIDAKNTRKGNSISFSLKKDEGDYDFYYENEDTHEKINPEVISNNSIREICNNIMLANSPMRTLKPGETADFKTLTYEGKITCN